MGIPRGISQGHDIRLMPPPSVCGLCSGGGGGGGEEVSKVQTPKYLVLLSLKGLCNVKPRGRGGGENVFLGSMGELLPPPPSCHGCLYRHRSCGVIVRNIYIFGWRSAPKQGGIPRIWVDVNNSLPVKFCDMLASDGFGK